MNNKTFSYFLTLIVLFLMSFTGYVLKIEVTLDFIASVMTLKGMSLPFPIIMNHMYIVVVRCPMSD